MGSELRMFEDQMLTGRVSFPPLLNIISPASPSLIIILPLHRQSPPIWIFHLFGLFLKFEFFDVATDTSALLI